MAEISGFDPNSKVNSSSSGYVNPQDIEKFGAFSDILEELRETDDDDNLFSKTSFTSEINKLSSSLVQEVQTVAHSKSTLYTDVSDDRVLELNENINHVVDREMPGYYL